MTFREAEVDYEVTTYREDVACDGRHAKVKFAETLPDDLSRRDFTMNALAKCAYTGEMVDPHGGLRDIENKTIRFVGKPAKRIIEDYLRILRGYRFLSKLGKGWTIHPFGPDIIIDACIDVMFTEVSKERIRDELLKMFAGSPCFALKHMPDSLIIGLFPEIPKGNHGHYHAEDIEIHSMVALATACRISKDPLFRLTAWLHDFGKTKVNEEDGKINFKGHEALGADTIRYWMNEMKFSNDQIKYVTTLVEHHMFYYPKDEAGHRKYTKRLIHKVGEDMLELLIMLRFCDNKANLANTTEWNDWRDHPALAIRDKLVEEEAAFKVTDLKVNGHDVMAVGFRGKDIGTVLNDLFNAVFKEAIKNDRDILLKAIELRWKNENR